MPKPINPSIGTCPCYMAECDKVTDVKKIKSGKRLYLVCPVDGTIDLPRSPYLQEFILENATIPGALPDPANDAGADPDPAPSDDTTVPAPAQDPPEPGPAPEPEPDPAPKSRDRLTFL